MREHRFIFLCKNFPNFRGWQIILPHGILVRVRLSDRIQVLILHVALQYKHQISIRRHWPHLLIDDHLQCVDWSTKFCHGWHDHIQTISCTFRTFFLLLDLSCYLCQMIKCLIAFCKQSWCLLQKLLLYAYIVSLASCTYLVDRFCKYGCVFDNRWNDLLRCPYRSSFLPQCWLPSHKSHTGSPLLPQALPL